MQRITLSGMSIWLLALAVAALANTGCATFNPDPLHVFVGKKSEPLDPAKAVLVEIRSENAPPQVLPLAHEDGMLVQDALAKSGVTKRFGRMNVSLVRPRPDGKGPHKMDVKYDPKTHRVSPGSDYAVLPGDRLIAIEDTTTEFDNVVDKLMGPFTGFTRKR